MVSAAPGAARREITVFVDSAGRVVRYADDASMFNGVDGGTGDAVVAALGRDGEWGGTWLHNAMQVANGGRGSDGRPLLPPRVAVKPTAPRALTAPERSRVRELAAWAARRCPA